MPIQYLIVLFGNILSQYILSLYQFTCRVDQAGKSVVKLDSQFHQIIAALRLHICKATKIKIILDHIFTSNCKCIIPNYL